MAGFRPVVRARGFWSQAGWRDHRACTPLQRMRAPARRRGMDDWMGLRSGARVRVFGVRQDEDTWLFSPRILADMSAALVETEENWNRRPGNSLSVMPPGENLIDGTCNLLDGVGEVSVIHADDGLACLLDRVRIFSYSISSSVFPCACLPTICRKVLYSRE
jgi:hypothetical protein